MLSSAKNSLLIVTVCDKVLSWKTSVVYIGSHIVEEGKTMVAGKHIICFAEDVVKRLNMCLFHSRAIISKLKRPLFSSAVFASLLNEH